MTTQITLNVIKATVLVGLGLDRITIDIVASSPMPAMQYEPLLKIETSPGIGAQWVRDNLGIDPVILDVSKQ